MNSYVQELQQRGAEALKSWQNIYRKIESLDVNMELPRQPIEFSTLDEMNHYMVLALEMFQGMFVDEKPILMLIRRNDVLNCLNSIVDQSNIIMQSLNQFPVEAFQWKDTNGSLMFQIQVNGVAQTNVELGPNFINISVALNSMLSAVGRGVAFTKLEGTQDLLERSNMLARLGENGEKLVSELSKRTTETSEKVEKIESYKKTIEANYESISLALNKASAIISEVEKDRATVNELVANVRELSNSADGLQEKVNMYKAQFNEFDVALSQRMDLFAELEQEVKMYRERANAAEAEIERIITKADSMIRGATTAGLSKGLDDTRDTYEKKRTTSRNCFAGSIVLLIILTVPLVLLMFPQLAGLPVRDAGTITIYEWFGRIALMLPGTWLTYFFSKAYAEYFHLEREYAHKAALAKSIEGFKREAQEYQEDITASVFFEVLTSPSLRKSPKAVQNPAIELLENKIKGWLSKEKKKTSDAKPEDV